MFTALANAIAFEVGFRTAHWFNSADALALRSASSLRKQFIANEVEELRFNSNLPVGTREITAEFLARAVAHKTQARIDASSLTDNAWYIVYEGTTTTPSHLHKVRYERKHAAKAAVAKLNALCERNSRRYAVCSDVALVANERLRIVHSAYNGAAVLESNSTPWSCSVASEAYWSN